jgi:hypothetical protein
MGWREALRELTRTRPAESGEKGQGPAAGAKGGGNTDPASRLFNKNKRNRSTLEQYRTVYENGGVVSQAIDAYALYTLMNGWHLEGEESLFEDIEDFLDEIGFDDLVWLAVVDALVFGDAIQEIELTAGATAAAKDAEAKRLERWEGIRKYAAGRPIKQAVYDVHPRAPETFEIRYDDQGVVQSYDFYKGDTTSGTTRPTATLKPAEVIHVSLLGNSARPIGYSLIGRAMDDIKRDCVIMESSTNAIKRHGWPKFHIKAGTPDQPITDKSTIDTLEKEFQSMDSKTEFVTSGNVELISLDATYTTGLALDAYNKVSIERLAAALGVPLEVLGLRVGTTDATAVSRQQGFYKRIQTFQRRIARVYNQQLIDRITGKPGSVWLVFNPANQPSERDIIAMFKDIASMDSLNGDLYVREVYERLEWDTSALDKAKDEAEVEVPVDDPMTDPSFVARQEKMAKAAGKAPEEEA